jgi:hypothetical protein
MIIVPFRDLRSALADPVTYVRNYQTGKAKMRASKYGTFRNAIFEYHKSDGKIRLAQDYLENHFKIFRDQGELPAYLIKLDTYAKEFRRLGTQLVRTRANVNEPLPKKFSNFRVSGQVARIDLSKGQGYNGWVFVRNDADWRSDPRMPLLQDALAKKLNADVDEVEIGVYDFVAGQHYATKFNLSQIKAAQKKLYALLGEFGK